MCSGILNAIAIISQITDGPDQTIRRGNFYLGQPLSYVQLTLFSEDSLETLLGLVIIVLSISIIRLSASKNCPSRKHTTIILTHLNPTFIQENWGLQG